MTLFEYISVAISMVMSLALVRLVAGVSHAFSPNRRYWVHLVWVATLLLLIALHWWNQWAYQDIADWNFLLFLSLLVAPGLLCFQAAALIPESPGEVASWRDHFYTVHRRFFIALALVFLTFNLTSWLWLGMPVVDPLRVVPVLLIVVALIGAFSLSQRVHGVLAVLVLAILVLATFWFFYRPGDFVSLWVSPK